VPQTKPALLRRKNMLHPSDAAICIQRRQRKRKSMWIHVSIERVRSFFVDSDVQRAIDNGNDATFYRDSRLMQRETLRTHPTVLAALGTAWEACSQGNDIMDRNVYFTMSRKLYIALCSPTARISPSDWHRCVLHHSLQPFTTIRSSRTLRYGLCLFRMRRVAEHDHVTDCGPKGYMTYEDFAACWFQLADLHTDDIGGTLYAEWILHTVKSIAQVKLIRSNDRSVTRPVWQWKDDLAILKQCTQRNAAHEVISTRFRQAEKDSSKTHTRDGTHYRQGRNKKVGYRPHAERKFVGRLGSNMRMIWSSAFKVRLQLNSSGSHNH
jgi:hypothetical protein